MGKLQKYDNSKLKKNLRHILLRQKHSICDYNILEIS